jgi:hypothetical protein
MASPVLSSPDHCPVARSKDVHSPELFLADVAQVPALYQVTEVVVKVVQGTAGVMM